MNRIIQIVVLFIAASSSMFAQGVPKLSIGKKKSKTIALNEKHSFNVDLKKGQFALVNLEQQGIDVKIMVYSPDGEQLDEFDSQNGSIGYELILIDGLLDGVYLIEIHPLGEVKRKKNGTYEITLIAISDDVESQLNQVIDNLHLRNYLPGFAVTIVDKDGELYKNAKGYANIAREEPYTMRTVQKIASISKTFISISLMLLVEEGKLTLDTPINELLPFSVTNPYFQNNPITIRHLATHTSTINDFPVYEDKSVFLLESLPVDKDMYSKEMQKALKNSLNNKDMPIAEFLKRMLTKDGEWYRKKNFLKSPPGRDWFYSNTGAALAALIVASVSGTAYDTFVTSRILEPLGLKSASWRGAGKEKMEFATNYTQNKVPLPKYKVITYPDSEIYINSTDLAVYLSSLIKGYSGEKGLITAQSFQEIMKVQHVQKEGQYKGRQVGLFWEYSRFGAMGHSGGDNGVTALMYFDPETKFGYTFTCNILISETTGATVEFGKIWSALKRYADFFNGS